MATVRRTTPVRTKAATEKLIAQLTQDIEALDTKLAEMSKEQEQFLLGSYVSQKVQHPSFGEGKELEDFLCLLPLDDNNAVFNLCCRLCSAYERKAFLDGLQYGAQLIQKLQV